MFTMPTYSSLRRASGFLIALLLIRVAHVSSLGQRDTPPLCSDDIDRNCLVNSFPYTITHSFISENEEMTWTLLAPPNQVISVMFSVFNFPSSSQCQNAHAKLTTSSSSDLFYTLCGGVTGPITDQDNNIFDSAYSFNLKASQVLLTAFSGFGNDMNPRFVAVISVQEIDVSAATTTTDATTTTTDAIEADTAGTTSATDATPVDVTTTDTTTTAATDADTAGTTSATDATTATDAATTPATETAIPSAPDDVTGVNASPELVIATENSPTVIAESSTKTTDDIATTTLTTSTTEVTSSPPPTPPPLTDACESSVLKKQELRNYASSDRTTFLLSAKDGCRLRYRFSYLQVEEDPSCSYDYLALFDGPNKGSRMLSILCGDSTVANAYHDDVGVTFALNTWTVISSKDLFVMFLSDSDANFGGFVLEYTGVNANGEGVDVPPTSPSPILVPTDGIPPLIATLSSSVSLTPVIPADGGFLSASVSPTPAIAPVVSCDPVLFFQCTDGACIVSTKKCDGNLDCSDGFDEQNCPTPTPTPTPTPEQTTRAQCTTDICTQQDGYVSLPDVSTHTCSAVTCTVAECCLPKAYCTADICTTGYVPLSPLPQSSCASSSCLVVECCSIELPTPVPVEINDTPTCSSTNYKCSSNWHLQDDSRLLSCRSTCSDIECCVRNPTCSDGIVCPNGFALLDNPHSTICSGATCTSSECCVNSALLQRPTFITGTTAVGDGLPVNCQGAFDCPPCAITCGTSVSSCIYRVNTPAANGGRACRNKDGANEEKPCIFAPCAAVPTPVPAEDDTTFAPTPTPLTPRELRAQEQREAEDNGKKFVATVVGMLVLACCLCCLCQYREKIFHKCTEAKKKADTKKEYSKVDIKVEANDEEDEEVDLNLGSLGLPKYEKSDGQKKDKKKDKSKFVNSSGGGSGGGGGLKTSHSPVPLKKASTDSDDEEDEFDAGWFQNKWETLERKNVTIKGRLHRDRLIDVVVLEKLLIAADFTIIASGCVDEEVKIYFFTHHSEISCAFLAELTIHLVERKLQAQIRCDSDDLVKGFTKQFWESIDYLVISRK